MYVKMCNVNTCSRESEHSKTNDRPVCILAIIEVPLFSAALLSLPREEFVGELCYFLKCC